MYLEFEWVNFNEVSGGFFIGSAGVPNVTKKCFYLCGSCKILKRVDWDLHEWKFRRKVKGKEARKFGGCTKEN